MYRSNLTLYTPLDVLRQHGRTIPIDGIKIEYGPQGAWEPVYRRTGVYAQFKSASDHQTSQIGPLPQDGGDFLPFLIAYRTIIESGDLVQRRIDSVRSLLADPLCARFVRALGDGVATGWAVESLARTLGIQSSAANSLFERGHQDAKSVTSLSDAELRMIPRVGPKTVAQIRLATRNG